MTHLTFNIVDVFAEQKYAGNPLAVFRGGAGLPSEEMQRIAREVNFSETTFILSETPRDGGYDVRIFTPKEEVPFAGHPTLGTAHLIRSELLDGKAEQVILNLKVGQIPVTFSPDGYAWMRQIEPVFGARRPAEALAGVLGLATDEIDERYPIEEVSTGLPFTIVPLKNLDSLQRARTDLSRLNDLIRDSWAKGILVFCPQAHEPGGDLSVRVFVDYFGIPEDPATGSGNGCLAGYLVKHNYFGGGRVDLRVEQGYEIGRPSLLLLKAEESSGKIQIWVGGKSVSVAQGSWG